MRLILSVGLLAACGTAYADQPFAIDWQTIDGGGGFSVGGDYEVEGTIGQPDAGAMSGGDFEMAGGFWVGSSQPCTSPQPVIDHSVGGDMVTAPCSGYIDPRPEGDVDNTGCPGGAVFGVSSVVMRFNTDVFQSDGWTPVDAGNFTVAETGGGDPPAITAVTAVGGDNSLIQIDLDRAITLAEWTTIIASDVYNDCGVQLDTSGGDQGPYVDEPDRIDIAFYPGDVNQDSQLSPFDLLAYRTFVQHGLFPAGACNDDELLYFDMDRNGAITPFDLLEFRHLVNSGCTRDWDNEPQLAPQP